ncbi:hypothetical protein FITA111629_00330 [Filibacter tadaridae]|uniref:Uncharacterized protein n=1 Tax=Filibacter tadaridae TaxID=2483811 RepID=A0A3P5X460_9BACL|nr:hypothetical protein [Filibacter tadaridae]VDC28944.1 hypothetical protein FILTAD_01915 [Filibacter tadaridae]
MTESNETNNAEEKKVKISFKDAVNQQLEAKKKKQTVAQKQGIANKQTKTMKSQKARTASSSHKKMGL